MQLQFSSDHLLDDGTRERAFTLGEVPGLLWTPSVASPATPVPLIVLGHPGRLPAMQPRLEARARAAARSGYATAALELPGAGARPAVPELDEARDELIGAIRAGRRPSDEVVDRLVLPLVDRAAPECRDLIDAVLALPEVREPVGLSGGVIALGVRLAATEPRLVAAGLFAGSFVPRSIVEEARGVTIPVHVLLQWDDRDNDRQMALDLFDAFGSAEKTLQANMGGHTGVPPHAGEDVARFFVRHLV